MSFLKFHCIKECYLLFFWQFYVVNFVSSRNLSNIYSSFLLNSLVKVQCLSTAGQMRSLLQTRIQWKNNWTRPVQLLEHNFLSIRLYHTCAKPTLARQLIEKICVAGGWCSFSVLIDTMKFLNEFLLVQGFAFQGHLLGSTKAYFVKHPITEFFCGRNRKFGSKIFLNLSFKWCS